MEIDGNIQNLTRATLQIVSPDEVFMVDYYTPEKSQPGSVAQGPQGFGASDAIALCLPFIYSFFSKFVEAAATEAGKKSFAAVCAWLSARNDSNAVAAKAEVKRILAGAGMCGAALDNSADAILTVLARTK